MFAGTNSYKQRRYEQGLCANCAKVRDTDKVLCKSCRDVQKESSKVRRAGRQAAGNCVHCALPRATNSAAMCYACWFRKICIDRTGNAKLAKEIQALFDKQGGKCAYTGEPIQLGANAQLDHKTPTPRGGKDVIDNLHWVSASVNLMKGQRTHKEFVALCKHIANRFS